MTYKNCKTLIEGAIKRNTKTEKFILDMETKLDVFRRGKRITEEEYSELKKLLNQN